MTINPVSSYSSALPTARPVATRPAIPSSTAAGASSTQVTISPQAVRRKSGEDRLTGMFFTQIHLHSGDPAVADKQARDFAYQDPYGGGGDIGGLIDLSGFDPGGDGIMRYSVTGEPVTKESKAYFNRVENAFREERIRIYETETAKGTPPAIIYDKLIAAMNAQPVRYREMMDWPLDYPDDFTRGTSYDGRHVTGTAALTLPDLPPPSPSGMPPLTGRAT